MGGVQHFKGHVQNSQHECVGAGHCLFWCGNQRYDHLWSGSSPQMGLLQAAQTVPSQVCDNNHHWFIAGAWSAFNVLHLAIRL